MKRTVYIETTVISYLTARPSRDLIVAAHQQITQEWWDRAAERFDLYASVIIVDEVSRGDPDASGKRLALLSGLQLLARTREVDELAACYARQLPIPEKAFADCYHLALACWHGMDYLASWNMAHLVNGEVVRRVQELNSQRGMRTPIICTPEELLEDVP